MRGESAVMRILDKGRLVMDLDRLGMEARDRELVERSITQIHGAVLVDRPDRRRQDDDPVRGPGRRSTLPTRR